MTSYSGTSEGFLFSESRRLKLKYSDSKVLRFIHSFQGKDIVLDIGCGVGIELICCCDYVQSMVGLEIDRNVIRTAQKALNENDKRNVDLVIGDALSLPFRPNAFSKILCFDVLEHLVNPKLLVSNMRNLLQKKGVCVIRIPNKWTIHEILMMVTTMHRNRSNLWNIHHVSFFDLKKIKKFFSDRGFVLVEGFTQGGLLNSIATVVYTLASIFLAIIFWADYCKDRYYFAKLHGIQSKNRMFWIGPDSGSKMPSLSYLSLLFSLQK